jgi:hypothetical protein
MHPEIFDKLLAVEDARKGRYTFLYEKRKRIPLTPLTIGTGSQTGGESEVK